MIISQLFSVLLLGYIAGISVMVVYHGFRGNLAVGLIVTLLVIIPPFHWEMAEKYLDERWKDTKRLIKWCHTVVSFVEKLPILPIAINEGLYIAAEKTKIRIRSNGTVKVKTVMRDLKAGMQYA